MKLELSTALRLGRVASLPPLVSNVIAAVVLAAAAPTTATVIGACVALAMMQLGGLLLNDAFDRDLDRARGRDRPIPRGEVQAGLVFDAGFVLLLGGIAALAVLAMATGAGGKPVVGAVALGALIVFYDAFHHGHRWAPILLGVCRAGVYVTTALLVAHRLPGALLAGAVVAGAYQALAATRARPRALLAGLALVDALLVLSHGRLEAAAGSVAAFALTIVLQAILPAA